MRSCTSISRDTCAICARPPMSVSMIMMRASSCSRVGMPTSNRCGIAPIRDRAKRQRNEHLARAQKRAKPQSVTHDTRSTNIDLPILQELWPLPRLRPSARRRRSAARRDARPYARILVVSPESTSSRTSPRLSSSLLALARARSRRRTAWALRCRCRARISARARRRAPRRARRPPGPAAPRGAAPTRAPSSPPPPPPTTSCPATGTFAPRGSGGSSPRARWRRPRHF